MPLFHLMWEGEGDEKVDFGQRFQAAVGLNSLETVTLQLNGQIPQQHTQSTHIFYCTMIRYQFMLAAKSIEIILMYCIGFKLVI